MFDEWPFLLTLALFFVGVLARANATYWLGRGARRGGERTRAARHLDRAAVRRAESLVARMGAAAVALSFLTVGVQTAVNFAAGALRMPVARYEVAAAVGSLAWAGIYTTIGFAVIEAWLGRAGAIWWLAATLAVVLVVVVTRAARRRLASPVAPQPEKPSGG